MIHPSDLRLMTRVARLYHEEGLTQTEVAHRLGLAQVAVSRLWGQWEGCCDKMQ